MLISTSVPRNRIFSFSWLNESFAFPLKQTFCQIVFLQGWVYDNGMINPLAIMQEHLHEIQHLGARRVGIFGSFARGDAAEDSDVDVYVEFEDAKPTYDNFFALHELLETFLGRRVDLVTDKALTETKAKIILPTVRYASNDS
jgi:predicted nucleotidyltransferase